VRAAMLPVLLAALIAAVTTVQGGSLSPDAETAGFGLEKRASLPSADNGAAFGLDKREDEWLLGSADGGFGLEKKKRHVGRFRSAAEEAGFGLDKRDESLVESGEAGFGLEKKKRDVGRSAAEEVGFGLDKRNSPGGEANAGFGLEKRDALLVDSGEGGFGLEKKKRYLGRFRSASEELGFGLDKRSVATDAAAGFGLEKRQHGDDDDGYYVAKRQPNFRLMILPLDEPSRLLPTVRRRRRVRSVDADYQVHPVSPHFGLE